MLKRHFSLLTKEADARADALLRLIRCCLRAAFVFDATCAFFRLRVPGAGSLQHVGAECFPECGSFS